MSGKAGIGIAVDIAGSVGHVTRSTRHILVHTLDTGLHTRMEYSSRGHTPEPLPGGRLRQSNR